VLIVIRTTAVGVATFSVTLQKNLKPLRYTVVAKNSLFFYEIKINFNILQ
jgi:hypothetical protein